MFKIESYVTPIILNYVAKYVKNIRPQDAQVSLWEGEVAFQNLDLRLDVLEEELNLPFEFLSGHIHELAIQVPWTKIKSEPIRITINTIEFVLKLKDARTDAGAGSSASSSPQRKTDAKKRKRASKQEEQKQQVQQTPGSGLVNKIINNIVVECHNIIIKYVEDDIVVSMNVQLLKYGSADEQWNYAMVDVHPIKVLMRKLVQISDLTICLDKRNAAGQIDVCQEPILYRCSLECRILRKYKIHSVATTSTTRIGILTKSMDMNISSLQFPMAMRLIKLLFALKSGKMHNASTLDCNDDEQDDQVQDAESGGSYLAWAWNLLPSFTFEPLDEEEHIDAEQPGHTMDVGVYVEQLNFTLKHSEFINDTIMGASKRIRYTPIVRISLGGMYCESVSAEEHAWSNLKAGVSSLCVEPLGPAKGEDTEVSTLVETSALENARAFIDKSLFDEQCLIADRGWGVTNYEEYSTRITDEYLLYRSPILAYDTVEYKAATTCENDVKQITSSKDTGDADDVHIQYRLLSAGITFRYNQTFLQVKNVINDLIDSYDYPAYYAEGLDTTRGNSPRLHPPLMEDYDALMQYIPCRRYKFDLQKINIEVYAKTDPEAMQKIQRRLSSSIKQTLPYFLLNFEHIEGSLTTPLQPDKLVHTTCQLPEKPSDLLDACYDNYNVKVRDFMLSLVHRNTVKHSVKLLHIPKLSLSYGRLLQASLWKDTEVPERKLDMQCEQFLLEFSKRELIASERLLNCIFHYQPYVVLKLANQMSRALSYEDAIKLQNRFKEISVQFRRHHHHDIWHGSLKSLQAELTQPFLHIGNSNKKYVVFRTETKQWLECQAQLPCTKELDDNQIKTALALWIDAFHIVLDKKVIEFLKYQEEPELHFEKETSAEDELQPQGSANNVTAAVSTQAQIQTHSQAHAQTANSTGSLKHAMLRRFSRNSQPSRKISHPEETIHLSSERDEKLDLELGAVKQSDSYGTTAQQVSWLKFVKTLILHIEIAQGRIDIIEDFQENETKNTEVSRIQLPAVLCKSSHAECIERSNLQHKISLPIRSKETLNWTITLNEFAIQYLGAHKVLSILKPLQTSITIALTHKQEKMKQTPAVVGSGLKEELDSMQQHKVPSPKRKASATDLPQRAGRDMRRHSSNSAGSISADGRSYSSLGMKAADSYIELNEAGVNTVFAEVKRDKHDKEKEREKEVSAAGSASKKQNKTLDIVTLNVHADMTPIHFMLSMQKVELMQQHFNILRKVVQLLQFVAHPNARSDVHASEPIKIVTAVEENPSIKEFLDLETNSESSVFSEVESIPSTVMSLFCQWTITRIIIELKNMKTSEQAQSPNITTINNNKIILELEDLLATVDKRDEFIKYTSKVGQFNMNYLECNEKGDWKSKECLRIKMLGETVNLPFCNVIVTSVRLKNFFKKIGAKRKGNSGCNRSISEILITMQATEIMLDLDKVYEFSAPLCTLLSHEMVAHEEKKKFINKNPMTVADMPMIHLDSKGFTLYLPTKAQYACASVMILKIESIKITPNLENPLQRNPIRTDVFSKAAQMGILATPGSMIEDRQYELTLRNISAASGNWHEILAHMHEQQLNLYRTNPAFEWNNQNRKTSLQLTDIFSNFNFIAIYAPSIVYNNILICGQALEFNCANDFIASLNTNQLQLMSCLMLRWQSISHLLGNNFNTTSKTSTTTSTKSASSTASRSLITLPSYKSLSSTQRRSSSFADARGSSSVFRSIEEDSDQNVKTDSGFQSCNSRSFETCNSRLNMSRERFTSLTCSSSVLLQQERFDQAHQATPIRYMPHTLSLIAGIFIIKIFEIKPAKQMPENANKVVVEQALPLFSFTISQPSFMITQNIYDSVIQVSLFDFNIAMSAIEGMHNTAQQSKNLFPELVFDTRPGELNASCIPPPLLMLKMHRTKMQLLEIDAEILRPIILTLIENVAQQMLKNLLVIYEVLLKNPCFELRPRRPVVRGTKIKLMRQQCFDADHLHFKCERIILRFSNIVDYTCKLVLGELKLNLKFLSRPEKATVRASISACHLHTERKVFIHPITLRLSADFVSEPWHRLPVVIATLKLNVVQVEVGIYALLQLRESLKGLNRLQQFTQNEWQRYLRNRPPEGVDVMQRERLLQLKCPSLTHDRKTKEHSSKNSVHREEFYQDDLRAGAFQFVELVTDAFLPLPYQIQIIKKNFGIICWRYPQPRKICKIHIFPVPMPVAEAIHIKCRLEYFSEANECFLHYCNFFLSETVSKEVILPEREICANIWRVVIQQSLISVNGECFDVNDEELRSIASMKIEDVLGDKQSDFVLHPKALVGCMRIDTTFQSESVPKIQLLVSCNELQIKLLNQPNENGELPTLLKKFRLAQSTYISQAFLVLALKRINFHASFYARDNYTLNSSLSCSVKCVDYGYLNLLYLLEDATLQNYLHINKRDCSITVNTVLDKLRINFGPSILHTLLSSKTHWDELLASDKTRKRHAFIPKCIVVNRTHSVVCFGQTGTTERIQLQPNECQLYSFRSDYYNQEMTFFIADDETLITEVSQSVPISLRMSADQKLQHIRIGNKCITIKSRRLSATQIYILIKGQIEFISMAPHKFRLEFRREGKQYEEKQSVEYMLEPKDRASFCCSVQLGWNINMRLKFANNKGKGRTGDIPLRTNKNLPWLVKVPTDSSNFTSFWVRVLRENICEISTDKFQPQKILITIWPIFEICSRLSCPVSFLEITTGQRFEVAAEGGRHILDVPATHLTEHQMKFDYTFPLATKCKNDFTLTLKNLEWNKFFWYDEQLWNIEDTLHALGKAQVTKWPFNDEEELRLKRGSYNKTPASIAYKCATTREFSCTLGLELAPWGLFINATGLDVSICDYLTKQRIQIESNCIEMMFEIKTAFTIDVLNGSNWIPSLPIYYEETVGGAASGRYYTLSIKMPIDIVILRDSEIVKFVLLLQTENERKIFKLRAKFVTANFTSLRLCVLPFAMDHKESATKPDVAALDGKVRKCDLEAVASQENCVGLTLDCFYDLNARKAQRSYDSAFVWFVCIKLCEESDFSIPIPLSMPFTRRCFSIQNGCESIPLVVTLVEKDGIYYLHIFKDISPAILISNETDMKFIVAQTSASENSKVSSTTPEYDGRHFVWYQQLHAYSKCYYTPPEMYANFPDVESTMCNLTLALCNEFPTKKNVKWSKPIRTDKTWEKFLHVPNHGDVKVIICDKHRIIRVSIFYVTQPLEFSVKDLRSRLLTPNPILEADSSDTSIATTVLSKTENVENTAQKLPSSKCMHFDDESQTKNQLKIRFFIKEMVLSFHTDAKERDCMKSEILSVYVDDFIVAYDDDDDRRQLSAVLTNLQMDNQLYSTGKYDFPVVLCAQNLYHRWAIVPQVHYLETVYLELSQHAPMAQFKLNFYDDEFKLKSLVCNFSPVRAYIEDAYLNDLLDVLVECEPSNCVYKPKLEQKRLILQPGQTLLPRDVVAQAICISEPLQLRSFRIEPLNVLLSVHTSVRLYIALDHSPLSFSTYERQQILTVPLRFGQSLGMHYLSGAIFGAGWVVGSLEILGSPSGLARSFTTGLRDFVSMPVEGLFRGPWGFIVGITQGSASLLRNVTAGTVNSVTKLAASVARNLDRLTLDPEHIERTEALRRSRPQGFTEGFSQGVTGLGISILGAVGGIARHTLEARSPVQIVTGMGKGIVGAFTKPISGAAELVALTGQGVLHTVGFNTMPEQRSPSVCHNMAVDPAAYRVWKLLPGVLASDQILFYHDVTLIVQDQPRRGYAVLTSAVFAVMEAQWDKMAFVFPVDKVEITRDADDKTLFYVHMIPEKEDIEEDLVYTNQRIMTFLHSSFSLKTNAITSESFNDLLQTQSVRKNLDWAFYISEYLGEHIMQYIKIINKKL